MAQTKSDKFDSNYKKISEFAKALSHPARVAILKKLAESDTWVTHQPRSNMNNGVGVAPVEGLLRSGVKVGLGTDGFSHTMWEEWKTW